jgi:hypothetical protein
MVTAELTRDTLSDPLPSGHPQIWWAWHFVQVSEGIDGWIGQQRVEWTCTVAQNWSVARERFLQGTTRVMQAPEWREYLKTIPHLCRSVGLDPVLIEKPRK